MKHWFRLCIVILIIGLLSACAANTEPIERGDSDEKVERKVDGGILGINVGEVLLKTAAVTEGLTSLASVAEVISESTIDGETSKIIFETKRLEKLSHPAVQHEKTTMLSEDGSQSVYETYFSEGHMYFLDDESNQWFGLPSGSQFKEAGKSAESQRLEKFAKMDGAFIGEEKGEGYVISFVGTDEQFKEVMIESAPVNAVAEFFENIDVTGTFSMVIDKNLFYVTHLTYEMRYTNTDARGKVSEWSKTTIMSSEFNEHDTLVIPDEVIQSALDYENQSLS